MRIRRSIKQFIQAFLRKFGLLERLQNSLLYDLYWSVADRRLVDARNNEVAFYREVLKGLRKGDLIFDVGANVGYKASIFLKLGARVLAIEPDEWNQSVLRRKFLRYRVFKRPLTILGKALGENNTVEKMWIDAAGSPLNTFSDKWVKCLRNDEQRFGRRLEYGRRRSVQVTTLQELFDVYGLPFFVKIDVEGYELNVLRGLKCPVPILSFEVNLPEFRSEGLQCIDVLANLADTGRFNFIVDCQRGFELNQWLAAKCFINHFREFEHGSVEVFWKTGLNFDH